MINFVWLHGGDHLHQAGITLERCGVQMNPAQEMVDAREPVLRVLNCHPADDAVDFIALFQQQFRQIASILPRYPGYKCASLISHVNSPRLISMIWSGRKPT